MGYMSNQPIFAEVDLFTTVELTRISPRGAALPQYFTNGGAIAVNKDVDGTWYVGPTGDPRPFTRGLPDLDAVIDFILGARALMAPVQG